MRGDLLGNEGMFSYLTPAQRVPPDHPLRPIRVLVDEVLRDLWPVFQRMYARTGRPSIPPERILVRESQGLRHAVTGDAR